MKVTVPAGISLIDSLQPAAPGKYAAPSDAIQNRPSPFELEIPNQ
jgi:hypothetical protein